MLELDRRARAINPLLELAVMLGLAVGAAGNVVSQHREVIRDNQVVLFIRPWPIRHGARLQRRKLFVISGLRYFVSVWLRQQSVLFREDSQRNVHFGCLCSGWLVTAPVATRAQFKSCKILKSWSIFRPNQIGRGSHGLRRKPFRD